MNTAIKTTPLFHTIKTILDAVDPEGRLSSGAPECGYDNESTAIAERLTPNMNVPQIAAVIRDVMNKAFCTGRDENGEQINPSYYGTDRYLSIAEDIYDSFGDLIDLSSGKPEFCTQETAEKHRTLSSSAQCIDWPPEEVIDNMFLETHSDGTYYGLEPFHDDCESGLISFKLLWNESDHETVKQKYINLCLTIKDSAETGKVDPELKAYTDPFDIDYTFLANAGVISNDDISDVSICDEIINGIITKIESEEELTVEEYMAYAEYKAVLSKEADRRIGKGLYSYELIQYARRLHRLIQLGAPKVCIDNEAFNLAQALVYHDYGEDRHLDYLDGSFKDNMV